MRLAIQTWCLIHPRRTTWIVCEFVRPLPIRRRFANAWWQVRHFNDRDAFDSLWQTWDQSQGKP